MIALNSPLERIILTPIYNFVAILLYLNRLGLGFFVTISYLLFGIIEWILSGKNQAKVKVAQKRMRMALFLFFIVFVIWVFLTIVNNFIGFQ